MWLLLECVCVCMCVGLHISAKNDEILKMQRIEGDKITDYVVTRVLAGMNQTSAHWDKDAEWMYVRTDERKHMPQKKLTILRRLFALKYDASWK